MDEPDDQGAAVPDPYSVIYGAIEALPDDQAPTGRATAIRAIAEQLVELQPSEREAFLKRLREKTGLPITALRGDIERLENELRRDARERERHANRAPQVDLYRKTPGGIVWDRLSIGGGIVPVPLTNFVAAIVGVVRQDDGASTRILLELEVRFGDGKPLPLLLTPQEFGTLNWVINELGPKAIVFAGFGIREHAKVAIQTLSSPSRDRKQYIHLGWTRLPEGVWAFLHSGGALGPDGPLAPQKIEVELPQNLGRYLVPGPQTGEALVCDIRSTLGLLELGPEQVLFPLFASPFAAVLGRIDFALHVSGPTGVFKSELASLIQSFNGAGFDSRSLPGSWSSTANALEAVAYAVKDAIFVVDDYAPIGTAGDIQHLQKICDRLFRGAGNQAGRLRMRADSSLQTARYPRSLILSTGEEIPGGVSLRARLLILELSPGDIDVRWLTECQRLAGEGTYARTLAAFIQWAARDLDQLRVRVAKRAVELRDSGALKHHARTHAASAQLLASFETFIQFAREFGAIADAEEQSLRARCDDALAKVVEDQAQLVRSADPVTVFQRLLKAGLAAGECHIADPDGKAPGEVAKFLGWRLDETGIGLRPQGDRVGWRDGDSLYLNITSAYRSAQRMAGEGERLTVTSQTLVRRIAQKGLLLSDGASRGKNVVQVRLEGARKSALHLRISFVLESESEPNEPQLPKDIPPSGNSEGSPPIENGAPRAHEVPDAEEQPAVQPEAPIDSASIPATGPRPCWTCGEARCWRLKGESKWTCSRCHPTIHPPEAIEIWPSESSQPDRGTSHE